MAEVKIDKDSGVQYIWHDVSDQKVRNILRILGTPDVSGV